MSQSKLTTFFQTKQSQSSTQPKNEPLPGPSSPKMTEISRPRGFCESWLSKYTWLYIEDGKMKCHPCVKTVKKPFVSP